MFGSLTLGAARIGMALRSLKLLVASLLAAVAVAAVMADGASASSGSSVADSDGYVPTYSVCYAGYEVGYYEWYSDGYAVYGAIYINDCALTRLGAGPYDRQQVVAHELGHSRGLLHSSDPYSYMYPYYTITGT